MTTERDLLGWAYGKLARFSYSDPQDLLNMDEIKLLLMGAFDAPLMVNGLTEAETNATASVRGLTTSAPEQIYLQACDDPGCAEGFSDHSDTTWCVDKINESDIAYTRTDLADARKDGVYDERNRCVALIARMAIAMGMSAGLARTAIEGWSEDWHGCVYVDLPAGQVSWHYHESQAELFVGLPPYTAPWDGHDTPEKYRRVGKAVEPGDEPSATEIRYVATYLAGASRRRGLVLTISQQPLQPLAMGNHADVIELRPARG